MKPLVLSIIVLLKLLITACSSQCTEINSTFIKKIDHYKKGKDALIRSINFLKEKSPNKDAHSVILWSNRREFKQIMLAVPNKGLENVYKLWEGALLIDDNEKAVSLYPNKTVYFLVKKCNNIYHYLVYDPTQSIEKIGITDEITYHIKVDANWEYVIQREE